jgi:phosphoribosylanthranilate isomerase
MWIKICGMTDASAVSAALAARVDAIGFIFAPSVRQLPMARAAELAAPARAHVRCVAVTLNPTQSHIDAILREFCPDVLQSDLADLARLRLPATLELLPVMRSSQRASASLPAPLPAALPGRILFEGPRSGAGIATDWTAAASLTRRTELVLAGGLGPDNVAAAIAAVRPFGVDVSSGVESAPGQKDPNRIGAFVRAARAAFAEAQNEHRHRD